MTTAPCQAAVWASGRDFVRGDILYYKEIWVWGFKIRMGVH